MDEAYLKWLNSLKEGDSVAIEDHYFTETKYILTKIKRITPKKNIKTEHYPDAVFKNGEWYASGTYSGYRKLIPVTQKVLDEVAYIKALHYVANLNFNKLPRATILAMYELVKPSVQS